jgi:hypothetical protein
LLAEKRLLWRYEDKNGRVCAVDLVTLEDPFEL